MEGFEHPENPLHPRGSKTLVDTIERTPEAWSGEGMAEHDPEPIDATFRLFDADAAQVAGTGSLGDIDFGDFLPVPDPIEDEDDIEALAEAALSGQTVLLDDDGNTVLDPPRRRLLPPVTAARSVEPSQPEISVQQMLPEDLLPPTLHPYEPPPFHEELDAEEHLQSLLRIYQPPESAVLALPELIETETFEVCWQGQANDGAPVAYFDVFVAIDDGPFEMWQEATSATSATYRGRAGQRYAFFSLATDHAGNRQHLPDGAQAWVRLQEPAPVSVTPVVEASVEAPVVETPVVETPVAEVPVSDSLAAVVPEPMPAESPISSTVTSVAEASAPAAPTQEVASADEPVVEARVEPAVAPAPVYTPKRYAPVLDPMLMQPLPALEMNAFQPEGHRVRDLLGEALTACEPDHDCGVAIVAHGSIGEGAWSYTLDEGMTWQPLPPVFHGGALLLGPNDRVRFVPRQMFAGTTSLTVRAWDQSTGKPGQIVGLVKPGTTGGESAFSATVATCRLPVVTTMTPPTSYRTDTLLPLVTGGPRGTMVGRLPGAFAGECPVGIAVVSLSGTADGHWQYSQDGGRTWRDFGSVFRGKARLLRAEDRVRFVPHGGYRGPARLTYHLWDQQEQRPTANVLRTDAVGDGTPFSSGTKATLWAL